MAVTVSRRAAQLVHLSTHKMNARKLSLNLACGICCPPFFVRKAVRNVTVAHHDVSAQVWCDCGLLLFDELIRSISTRICTNQHATCLVRGDLLCVGSTNLITPFAARNAVSSAPSSGKMIGSRHNTMCVHAFLAED